MHTFTRILLARLFRIQNLHWTHFSIKVFSKTQIDLYAFSLFSIISMLSFFSYVPWSWLSTCSYPLKHWVMFVSLLSFQVNVLPRIYTSLVSLILSHFPSFSSSCSKNSTVYFCRYSFWILYNDLSIHMLCRDILSTFL